MVNDALEGTLSSYSHCLLLIHFLQSVAVLPNLQDTSGIPDAAERAKFGDIDLFDGVVSLACLVESILLLCPIGHAIFSLVFRGA